MHFYTYLCICSVVGTVYVVLVYRSAPVKNGIGRYFKFSSERSLFMGTREVFGKSAKLLAEVLVSEDAPYIPLLQRLYHFSETWMESEIPALIHTLLNLHTNSP